MEAIIGEVQSLFTQEIFLDATFHPRLIGQKGRNLKKVILYDLKIIVVIRTVFIAQISNNKIKSFYL